MGKRGYGKPRMNTEWIKTLEDGWNVLVGANKEKIVRMANEFGSQGRQKDVFGDGDASEKVVNIIGR